VRAEDHRLVGRDFIERIDKNNAFCAQPVDDVAIMHNFVVHVQRRAINRKNKTIMRNKPITNKRMVFWNMYIISNIFTSS
jgi:hypothetical protein